MKRNYVYGVQVWNGQELVGNYFNEPDWHDRRKDAVRAARIAAVEYKGQADRVTICKFYRADAEYMANVLKITI